VSLNSTFVGNFVKFDRKIASLMFDSPIGGGAVCIGFDSNCKKMRQRGREEHNITIYHIAIGSRVKPRDEFSQHSAILATDTVFRGNIVNGSLCGGGAVFADQLVIIVAFLQLLTKLNSYDCCRELSVVCLMQTLLIVMTVVLDWRSLQTLLV
jgi:hypothetical protein